MTTQNEDEGDGRADSLGLIVPWDKGGAAGREPAPLPFSASERDHGTAGHAPPAPLLSAVTGGEARKGSEPRPSSHAAADAGGGSFLSSLALLASDEVAS